VRQIERVSGLSAWTYRVPTRTSGRERPESDGTASWDHTDVLVIEVRRGDVRGLGYSYASPAALSVLQETLAPLVLGADVFATPRLFWTMARSVRNLGWPGVAAGAISAVDIAVHDLKARLLDVPLLDLLGASRERVVAYGSGGFTDYSDGELTGQLEDWMARGIAAVKIKVGSHPDDDPRRIRLARQTIGERVALFIDANGALARKQALGLAVEAASAGVSWFEEPVSSDDLAGLRLLRDRAPAGMSIAAGEYAYTPAAFRDLIAGGAVDVVQADATRCGGVTGFMNAAQQCIAAGIPLSAHTAPAIHAVLGCAARPVIHIESFHDHELVEALLFEGCSPLVDGCLVPDRGRAGHGLSLRDHASSYQTAHYVMA